MDFFKKLLVINVLVLFLINSLVYARHLEYQEIVVPEELGTELENYDIIDGDVPTPDPDIDFEEELSGSFEYEGGSSGGGAEEIFDCDICEQRLKLCKMMCYTEECKVICVPLFEDCMATCTCEE